MSGETTVTRVGPTAASLLSELQKQCFDRPCHSRQERWPQEAWADLLVLPGVEAFLLSQEDNPVGFLLTRQALDEAEILSLGILLDHRRQGLAKHLVRHYLAEKTKAGVLSVFLEVADDNRGAAALYRALGFEIVGTRPGYYQRENGKKSDALTMLCSVQSTSHL